MSLRRPSLAVAALLLCLILPLSGCRTEAATPPNAAAKRMIEKVMDRYVAAYRKNDPDAMAELYAKEAILLPPGHELVKGRDSVRAFWSRGMETGFEMAPVAVEVSGATAYVVGRYYVPPDDEDGAETGKYIVALRLERDGVWRITADIWNADDSDDQSEPPADSAGQAVAVLSQVFETITQSP